jgi:hypothetical protein
MPHKQDTFVYCLKIAKPQSIAKPLTHLLEGIAKLAAPVVRLMGKDTVLHLR